MRVLIAPDKFKGTLSAREAAEAIARGVRRAAHTRGIKAEMVLCPVADGGEGSAAIVEAALKGSGAFGMDIQATDLLSAPVTARCVRWEHGGGGFTTLIESAQVIGLARVPADRRDPTAYTSAALGRLLGSVRFDNEARVLIALGGSATVDGGVGAAQELGWRARMPNPKGVPYSLATEHLFDRDPTAAGELTETLSIEPRDHNDDRSVFWRRLRAPVRVLCDVDNPLLGENGAAKVYGAQKGATPAQVEQLERGLAHLVDVCRKCGIACDPDAPGAGAAGGLGFGLATFLGAQLVPGARSILDLIGFDRRLRRADVVITGEGRLDQQTGRRKAPMEVAGRARDAGVAVLAVVGSVDAGAPIGTFDAVTACEPGAADPAVRLEEAAAACFGGWMDGRQE